MVRAVLASRVFLPLAGCTWVLPSVAKGAPPSSNRPPPLPREGSCGFCCQVMAESYARIVVPRLREGVPFELLALTERQGNFLCQAPVQVSYSLWDERMTLTKQGSTPVTARLDSGLVPLCQLLTCPVQPAPSGGPAGVRFRVLLNPQWEGRVARLKGTLARGGSKMGFVNIDWGRILEKLPSEQVVFEGDVRP